MPSHGIAFLSVWPDTAQDWMRGDMKGVRALFTLKIKFLGYLKNAWRQEWEETASRDYHKLACSMGGRKGRMSFFSLRCSP